MNEYFNWSKVYQVSHSQGSYTIFTAEYGKGYHAGVILPSAMDDIWNMAGSRMMQIIETEQRPAHSQESVLMRLTDWLGQNLKGQFVIREDTRMEAPCEESDEDIIPALRHIA
ncbi:MAG: hypothetical protein JST06_04425 [Bacteroidetes bacterium]|nr:hypothetical protein [Bacteroidota bacterium]MBS1630290.1 hypothetical protein [Bacteroidota bacterium]